jgi:Rrf2 family protein
MRLSTKSRYGLRAALAIARKHGKEPAKRKDIAQKEGLSNSYLENILLILRNHKIVETSRGVKGGYALRRSPAEITVYDIVNALEGPLSIVDCVEKPKSCPKAPLCIAKAVWCDLAAAVKDALEKVTLQMLLDRERKSGTIEYSI